jgi:ornithine cyclodeaminase
VRVASPQGACEAADVIVTATPARAPLFEAAWVRPGTHVAAMGVDAKGKQELPPALLERARLFCDLPEQSRTIGEFQHASAQAQAGLRAIGDVLRRGEGGRTDPAEITVFDSSGIALQDLTIARAILAKADARL